MKKQISRMCTFILTLLLIMIVAGCGEGFRIDINAKPDDDISEAIYEAVGRKKVYYQSKKSFDLDEPVIYEYLVNDYEDEKVLKDMVDAANAVMEEREMVEKSILVLWEKMPGGYEEVARLRTYYKGEDGYEEYGSFQTLYIFGTKRSHMSGHSPYDKI